MPRVSVIIPTYNRREYVQEAIDSVLTQTYTDYEIIVIDDGSTDGTGEALQARYGDRIHYEWQENQGESVARNRGIELAQGEYIAFLDSDDLWLPEKLEKQARILDENPNVGLVYAQAQFIDEDGVLLESGTSADSEVAEAFDKTVLYFWNPIGGPSKTLICKAVLDRVGGFDPQIRFGEDRDLWFRIADQSKVLGITEVLVAIRRHRGGQAYYPNAQHNARRLADRVKMLTKAFERDGVTEAFKRKALARQYAEAFIWEHASGHQEAALKNLQRAGELDADFVRDLHGLGQIITDHISRLAADGNLFDFQYAVTGLTAVLASWTQAFGRNRKFERGVRAQAYVALSFMAARADQRIPARRYAILAMMQDPGWLRNYGLVKNLLGGLLQKSRQGKRST